MRNCRRIQGEKLCTKSTGREIDRTRALVAEELAVSGTRVPYVGDFRGWLEGVLSDEKDGRNAWRAPCLLTIPKHTIQEVVGYLAWWRTEVDRLSRILGGGQPLARRRTVRNETTYHTATWLEP